MLAVERLKKLHKRHPQSSSRDSTPISGAMPRWSADMAANGTYVMASRQRSQSGDNVSKSRESSPFSIAAGKSIDEVYRR